MMIRSRKTDELCAAAADLFLQRGFDAVTMDDVALAAGVSKATLYAHVGSKESLFAAVMAREVRLISERIWSPASSLTDVSEVLSLIAVNYFDVFTAERTFLGMRTVAGVISRFPSLGRLLFDEGPAALLGHVAGFFAEAHADGRLDVKDPKLAASQFLSLCRGDLDTRGLFSLEMPSKADVAKNTEAAVRIILEVYRVTEHPEGGATANRG